MVRISFLKLGNIATSTMIELLLDERAERDDMEVRVLSSGANMGSKQAGTWPTPCSPSSPTSYSS